MNCHAQVRYMLSQFRLSSVVCLSVTLVHPTQPVEIFGNLSSPYDSAGTLVFWCQNSLVGDAPFPLKFAFKVTPLSNIRPISAHSASTVIASEKVQLALIGSRQRAFQRAIDEPCTLPLSPPTGGTKTRYRCLCQSNSTSLEKSLLQSFFVWKRPAAKL